MHSFQVDCHSYKFVAVLKMIHINNIWRIGWLCLLSSVGYCQLFAQGVVFTAAVSADRIGVQDQLQVQFTIQDANELQSVSAPSDMVKDFSILGGPYQAQSTSMQIANGKMSQTKSISITYILQPKRTGNLTIGAAVAKDAEGHTFQSNVVPIQVVQGSLAAQQQQQQRRHDPFHDDPFEALMRQRQQQLQALRQQRAQPQQETPVNMDDLNKNLFIKVVVDKSKVHVGEQITATYKLYARVPMNVGISKLPSLNGFWTQDFEMPKGTIKPVEEIIGGKKFQVFTLKKSALFPQQTGTLELDPAEAEGVARIVQQSRQRSNFDDPFAQAFGSLMMNDPFFNDDMFGSMAYRDVKVHLKSSPVKITVLDLPEEGKPANYGNAVGNFTVSSKIDKTELTTDDVLNLKLTITGSGNLKLIEAPALALPNGLDSYDPLITDTITGRSTTISGSKIITYAIQPNTPGDFTIPAIPFTYFNAQTGKYVTIETQPVKVHIKQGKSYKKSIAQHVALSDIHNIDKKPLNNLDFNSKPLFLKTNYWMMYAMSLLLFAGVTVWKRREEELTKDTVLLRNKRANKIALKRLVTAKKLLQQNNKQPFYEEVSKAIWLYLSDKLNIPLSSLSREKAQEVFVSKNVPVYLQQRIEHVLNDCETALYAGNNGSQQMNKTYTEAVEVISKLEEIF